MVASVVVPIFVAFPATVEVGFVNKTPFSYCSANLYWADHNSKSKKENALAWNAFGCTGVDFKVSDYSDDWSYISMNGPRPGL